MPPPQPPEVKPTKPKDVIDLAFLVANVHAGFITPFTRCGFGTHSFAAYPLTLALMWVYAGFARCPQLLSYIPVWLAMVGFRMVTAERCNHSRYQGYPWVFGWAVGEYFARWLEPVICLGLGALLATVSMPLGKFVGAGAASMWIVWMIELTLVKTRQRMMRDAHIEAEQFQRGGW